MKILKKILRFILSVLEIALLFIKIITPFTKLIGIILLIIYASTYIGHWDWFMEHSTSTKICIISTVVIPLFLGLFIDLLVCIIKKIRTLLN